MANQKNMNFVSFGLWMFALFIKALPCIGVIMESMSSSIS